jgi:hypothetical protein
VGGESRTIDNTLGSDGPHLTAARTNGASGSELNLGRDRHVKGVDEVGVKKLPDRGRPATESDILALRGLPGPLEDRGRIAVDEVECGVRQGERRALVVRHHEYRSVERRLVAPPALPVVVAPRAA